MNSLVVYTVLLVAGGGAGAASGNATTSNAVSTTSVANLQEEMVVKVESMEMVALLH